MPTRMHPCTSRPSTYSRRMDAATPQLARTAAFTEAACELELLTCEHNGVGSKTANVILP